MSNEKLFEIKYQKGIDRFDLMMTRMMKTLMDDAT